MFTDGSRSIVSLFSGCGGFDLGFKQAGFTPISAFDIDAVAISNYQRNVGSHAKVADLKSELPTVRGKIAVLLAGPPCQGFSTAGHRDPDDARNTLLPLAGELAVRLKPQVIVIENVAAATSGDQVKHWNALDGSLRLAGYRTHSLLVNASDLGLAQRRRRILLFGWRTDREPNFVLPQKAAQRLDQVLSGVEDLPNHDPKVLEKSSRLYKIALRIGPGQKLCNVRGGVRSVHTWHIPEVFGTTTAAECALLETVMRLRRTERQRDFGDADPVSLSRLRKESGKKAPTIVDTLIRKKYLRWIGEDVDLVHTFNGKCRRFRWEDIACTVDTRFGDPQLFLHPNEHRPFTAREAARLQGFPDDFIFSGSARDQFRLIGNAVPPAMGLAAANIALRLLK